MPLKVVSDYLSLAPEASLKADDRPNPPAKHPKKRPIGIIKGAVRDTYTSTLVPEFSPARDGVLNL
jgi:hypothetical protein